ncbi:zinc-binding dehydrogenase [Mycolicibacterium mucogenicum]|uniref:zinc-binding dehydrogenase n=1 Tax=Mycolicibacterium TaxID=1866885 RepID=UPI00226AE334|nr:MULTISPECIES: zinc-binding dehydrogenase [Mycolicibacterium]MCX8560881.1 zinc-binding dehydrogenase [Mycolicibacterium mucogenicum]
MTSHVAPPPDTMQAIVLTEGWRYVDAAGLPVAEVADAHRLVEAGHVRGKVILATHTD